MARDVTYLVCLGATKAGTSWLWDHLAHHPECHLRTIKEYNFFFLSDAASFDSALKIVQNRIARQHQVIAALPEGARDYANRHLADLQAWQALLESRTVDLAAYRDFLLSGRADQRLVGDFTPAYGLLSVKRIGQMAQLDRDTRFVYLLRDPLARAWSHIRMVAANLVGQGGDMASLAQGVLHRLVSGSPDNESKWLAERGDYARILPKLDRALVDRPFLVQFYEDLITAPGLARMQAFLGISQRDGALETRVHQGVAVDLMPEDRGRLLTWLRPQYDYIAARYPVLPVAWRMNMEQGVA